MVILGQSIKIMGTFATCIHIIYHSRYFLERICDIRKIQSKILLYYSVIFIYFISKLLCCSYIVYFEALLITTYLVLEIQLHTLLADLRDGLLLRQAAADELQRDEHLQLSFSLWSSFLTSTLLLPVIMQYQFYDLDDKCSWVLPRLIHFLNIDIKIDTQYPKKTHK